MIFVVYICCVFVSQHDCIFVSQHDTFQTNLVTTPQWGAADAEIKIPSGENTELKRFPFKAWSRSVYSLTYCAYCQGFLPCLFLPFQSIHLHLFQNLSRFFPVLAVANICSCVGLQNKIGHLDAGSCVECWRNINRLKKDDLWYDDL